MFVYIAYIYHKYPHIMDYELLWFDSQSGDSFFR